MEMWEKIGRVMHQEQGNTQKSTRFKITQPIIYHSISQNYLFARQAIEARLSREAIKTTQALV